MRDETDNALGRDRVAWDKAVIEIAEVVLKGVGLLGATAVLFGIMVKVKVVWVKLILAVPALALLVLAWMVLIAASFQLLSTLDWKWLDRDGWPGLLVGILLALMIIAPAGVGAAYIAFGGQ